MATSPTPPHEHGVSFFSVFFLTMASLQHYASINTWAVAVYIVPDFLLQFVGTRKRSLTLTGQHDVSGMYCNWRITRMFYPTNFATSALKGPIWLWTRQDQRYLICVLLVYKSALFQSVLLCSQRAYRVMLLKYPWITAIWPWASQGRWCPTYL